MNRPTAKKNRKLTHLPSELARMKSGSRLAKVLSYRFFSISMLLVIMFCVSWSVQPHNAFPEGQSWQQRKAGTAVVVIRKSRAICIY